MYSKWFIQREVSRFNMSYYRQPFIGERYSITLSEALAWCEGNCLDPLKVLCVAGRRDGHNDILVVVS